MNNPSSPEFTPTESWQPDTDQREVDGAIQRAVTAMNERDPDELIDTLKQSVEQSESGISYAVLKGQGEERKEYSDTEALVMFNPFANAATPNQLVRAEFMREVAKQSDVRDPEGKFKPVVMLASPGIEGSSYRLSREERAGIRQGELGPVARELLRAVSEKDIGKVSLLGFSQGADIALAGARTAYSANLDTQSVAAGDPAGVEQRSMPKLAGDFFKVGAKDLKKAVGATGLDAQEEALGTGTVDFARFGASAAVRPSNWALYKGLGNDVLNERVKEILSQEKVDKLVIGYGGDSAIAKPENIEPTLAWLHEIDELRGDEQRLFSVKVEDRNHAWGDQLDLLAKLYMQSVS